MKVYKTACRGLPRGLSVRHHSGGRQGDPGPPRQGRPLNRGRGCVKGMSIIEQMYHPDRLTYPKKAGGAPGQRPVAAHLLGRGL